MSSSAGRAIILYAIFTSLRFTDAFAPLRALVAPSHDTRHMVKNILGKTNIPQIVLHRTCLHSGFKPEPEKSHSQNSEKLWWEIDFGKVGFSSEEAGLNGMVFRPEETEEDAHANRIDWDSKCEKAINDQINVEYTASYAYHALSSYFDRDTVGLSGFSNYFKHQSDEEREHAENFMRYQNKRGGEVSLKPVAVPEMHLSHSDGVSDALYAMELSLQLEKFVFQQLKKLHGIGMECNDPELCHEIDRFLRLQVEEIDKHAKFVAQIRRTGTGHGIWDLDQELQA